MQKTTNYNLNLPEKGEFYNVDDFNENAEILDEKLKEVEDAAKSKDADTLGGKGASEYVQRLGAVTDVYFLNYAYYTFNYECNVSPTVATSIGLPVSAFYHIKYYAHGTNGFATQVAMQYNSTNIIMRVSDGNGFTKWIDKFADYLPKTGGTVSNSGGIPLTLQGSNVSYVKFTNSSGTQLGLLGAYTDGSPVYSDGSTVNKLLHTGNSNKLVFTEDDTTAPADTTALWAHL